MAHRWDYTCSGTDYLGEDAEKADIEACDGTTFYAVDTKKLYVYYKNEWHEM